MTRSKVTSASSGPLLLDHMVINTRFDMARAARLFAGLGFTLTPQSRHTLGSINHLMVFGTDYLELVGLPDDGGPVREEILNSAIGIDGLVFQDDNVDSMAQRLGSLASSLAPVGQFSRPVTLAEGTQDASFRTARFVPGRFAAGRVYYCQHLTPELIWRQAWQHHANTARHLNGMVVVAADPAGEAAAYAQAAFAEPALQTGPASWQVQGERYVLTICDHATYQARFGALACEANGRDAFFGAIDILVDDLAMLQRVLPELGDEVRFAVEPAGVRVKLPAFNALLSFSTVPASLEGPEF